MSLLYNELKDYEHIIFDWNGTLLSDVEIVHGIIESLLDHHDQASLSLEEFRDRFHFPILSFYTSIGLKEEHFDSVQELYHKSYMSSYKQGVIYEDSLDLLKTLKTEGKTLSILSASEQNHLNEAVEHFGIVPHVHHVYGVSNQIALGKKERGAELLSTLSIPREKTIIVGDTLLDAEVGAYLNIDVLLVGDGHQSLKQLSQSKCKVLASRYK